MCVCGYVCVCEPSLMFLFFIKHGCPCPLLDSTVKVKWFQEYKRRYMHWGWDCIEFGNIRRKNYLKIESLILQNLGNILHKPYRIVRCFRYMCIFRNFMGKYPIIAMYDTGLIHYYGSFHLDEHTLIVNWAVKFVHSTKSQMFTNSEWQTS